MDEYIKREEAIEDVDNLADYMSVSTSIDMCLGMKSMESRALSALNAIPAADVVEVRHGRWIDSEEDGHLSICGVCNYPVDRFYKTKYCPNCGAKMDGGVNDATG